METVTGYYQRRDKILEALLSKTPKVLSDLGLNKIVLTPSVSNWLTANGMTLKREEALVYANYLNDALHWFEEFQRVPVTADVVHQIVETLIQQDMNDVARQTIKCRGGCSSCCYIKVSATEEEGRILARLLPPGGVEKITKQAEARTLAEWQALSDDDAACVFLDRFSGRCTVYEHRPSVCRLAYSLTGPTTCGRKPQGQNKAMVWYRAEAAVAAYLSLRKVGGMANMILEGLE